MISPTTSKEDAGFILWWVWLTWGYHEDKCRVMFLHKSHWMGYNVYPYQAPHVLLQPPPQPADNSGDIYPTILQKCDVIWSNQLTNYTYSYGAKDPPASRNNFDISTKPTPLWAISSQLSNEPKLIPLESLLAEWTYLHKLCYLFFHRSALLASLWVGLV